jgi:hypothetical protein
MGWLAVVGNQPRKRRRSGHCQQSATGDLNIYYAFDTITIIQMLSTVFDNVFAILFERYGLVDRTALH